MNAYKCNKCDKITYRKDSCKWYSSVCNKSKSKCRMYLQKTLQNFPHFTNLSLNENLSINA